MTWPKEDLQKPEQGSDMKQGNRRSRPKGLMTTSCTQSGLNLGPGKYSLTVASPCPRVKLPYSKEANQRGCFPSGCVKRRTYSECRKDPMPDRHPSVCFCLITPPMCVVWNCYRKKQS